MIIQRLSKQLLLGSCLAVSACGNQGPGDDLNGDSGQGTLRASIAAANPHDVARVRYRLVAPDASCSTGNAIAETVVALETRPLPDGATPPGSSADHRFADAAFTLAPGSYRVCVAPLTLALEPSAQCAPAESVGSVVANATAEVRLVAQCSAGDSGGIDIVTVLNDPPRINQLLISPSRFLQTCEEASLSASASDPNLDEVKFSWSVVGNPAGVRFAGSGNSVIFSAQAAGDYDVKLTATDAHGSATSLTFPLYVSGAPCGIPPL